MNAECIHETNPMGGFAGSHKRFCGYGDCCADAIVHVVVEEPRWCGNVCRGCAAKVGRSHRVLVEDGLRGLLTSEENNGETEN